MFKPLRLKTKQSLTDPERKRSLNTRLFTVVAPRYDLITRLLSFGRDRVWKDRLIDRLPTDANPPCCLDMACGTGDLTVRLAEKFPAGQILGLDITPAMAERARNRFAANDPQVSFMVGDMARSGLPDASFDIIVGGYALRNAGDLDEALAEAFRLLKANGCASFLDFSKPTTAVARFTHHLLLKVWGGFWGIVLHGNARVYTYIADSLAAFPDRKQLAERFRANGFHIERETRFFAGMVCITRLRKPRGKK